MSLPEQENRESQNASSTSTLSARASSDWRWTRQHIREWAARHIGEIAWAFVFAVLAGYAIGIYLEDPKPYTIYVIADKDTNSEIMVKNFLPEEQKESFAKLGDVKVRVKIETLNNQDAETAKLKAQELVNRPDTLMVIQHGRSQHVENSLQTYLGTRPQIPVIATVATDDDLLIQCKTDDSCYDEGWFQASQSNPRFVPVLQLSPTNEVQGRSAVQFATQKNKRRFLIVSSNDPINESYTNNMVKAYSVAVQANHAELIGIRKTDSLPTEQAFERLRPDCVLYAGGVGEAQVLFNYLSSIHLPEKELLVIFSDSVIESRGTDEDLAAFTQPSDKPAFSSTLDPTLVRVNQLEKLPANGKLPPSSALGLLVHFTYQTDASDYNAHTNGYADDSFSIAQDLLKDLNDRGGDFRYTLKALLHIHNVVDARRSLVSIMKQNSISRTWYKSASGRPYVFEGARQYGGMFHVWQLKWPSTQPGSEMDDVDPWHFPKAGTISQDHSSAVAQK